MFLLMTQFAVAADLPNPDAKDAWSVRHEGTRTGETLAWETSLSTAGAGGRVLFAFPVEGPMEVEGGATAVEGPGGIVGLDVGSGPRTLVVRTHQERDTGLYPPLLAGDEVQRVTLTNLDWVPDPSLGFEVRLGRTTLPEIPRSACLDGYRLAEPRPICLVADERVLGAGGLPGTVRARSESRGAFAVVISCAFAGLVGVLVVGNRWLTRRAKDEVLEAYVREEFVKR